MADNRRIQTRHEVAIPAKLIVDGITADCTMLNLSVGGALVTVNTKYAMGQRIQLAFHVPTMPGDVIEVGATVRWSSTEGVGVQFDGLRARDVWALQAYFKQLPA